MVLKIVCVNTPHLGSLGTGMPPGDYCILDSQIAFNSLLYIFSGTWKWPEITCRVVTISDPFSDATRVKCIMKNHFNSS